MGVRQSKLDQVPSLALGTSPVTLKEMVSAFGSIANGGNYVEPVLVTRIENRKRAVLQEFHSKPPEPALSYAAAQTLLDVMRGVIDQGTGVGIRRRFGIEADVAGKTGTTQDNTDGWFILMHPQLVAGAWVGFNDNRITMRGDWGQGARNALNVVGDFFRQSLRASVIDANLRFTAPRQQGVLEPLFDRVNDWLHIVFPPAENQPLPEPAPWPEPPPAEPEPAFEMPLVVEPQPMPEAQRAPLPEFTPRPPATPPEVLAPQARAPRRIESLPRIVIAPPGVAPQFERPLQHETAPVQAPQPTPMQTPQAAPMQTPQAATMEPQAATMQAPQVAPAQEPGRAQAQPAVGVIVREVGVPQARESGSDAQ
jgi:penicillin-binding protein 1A